MARRGSDPVVMLGCLLWANVALGFLILFACCGGCK